MNVLKAVGGLSLSLGVGSWVMGRGRSRCQAEEEGETLPWNKENLVKKKIVELDWLIHKNVNDLESGVKTPRKTLLLSNVRTGSSFTADVLSSSPSTSYFMEPLFALMPLGQLDWDYFLEGAITDNPRAKAAVKNLMEGIFRCDKEVTSRLEEWSNTEHNIIAAVGTEECLASRDVLVKTVR